MTQEISIRQFREAIRMLPEEKPVDRPGVWYRTQKEHWLCWLCRWLQRAEAVKTPAQSVYNRIECSGMLLWLISAAKVEPKRVNAARLAEAQARTAPGQAAAVRKHVPWELVAAKLWATTKDSYH